MDVYLVLSKNRKWYKKPVSNLLMFFEKTNFSHSSILINDGAYQYMFESVAPISQRIMLEEWVKHYEIVDSIKIDSSFLKSDSSYIFLYSMLGRPYSFKQIFYIAIGIINEAFLHKIKWVDINSKKAMICTELVARFLKYKYDVYLYKSPDLMGLNDIKVIFNIMKKGENSVYPSEL